MAHVLTQLKSVSRSQRSPVAAFSIVRNERRLLPHFLEHYRQLGVEEFYFVDNDSTDGTREWLAEQSDVNLFRTRARYSESNCGTTWINALISEFGLDRWCLHVDADELFVYAGCEHVSIDRYAASLDAQGARGVFAFMLDLYASGAMREAAISDSVPPLKACGLHDSQYVFRNTPRKPWAGEGFPRYEVIGGPRMRLWGGNLADEAATTWFNYFLRGQIDRVVDWVPQFAFESFVKRFENQPPHLQKVPFVRPGQGFRYHMGAHSCDALPLAEQTAALLHFKFTSDFYQRVVEEASRGEHFHRGAQYIRYRQILIDQGRDSMVYPGSVAYRDSQQLAELGLIRSLSSVI